MNELVGTIGIICAFAVMSYAIYTISKPHNFSI